MRKKVVLRNLEVFCVAGLRNLLKSVLAILGYIALLFSKLQTGCHQQGAEWHLNLQMR